MGRGSPVGESVQVGINSHRPGGARRHHKAVRIAEALHRGHSPAASARRQSDHCNLLMRQNLVDSAGVKAVLAKVRVDQVDPSALVREVGVQPEGSSAASPSNKPAARTPAYGNKRKSVYFCSTVSQKVEFLLVKRQLVCKRSTIGRGDESSSGTPWFAKRKLNSDRSRSRRRSLPWLEFAV